MPTAWIYSFLYTRDVDFCEVPTKQYGISVIPVLLFNSVYNYYFFTIIIIIIIIVVLY